MGRVSDARERLVEATIDLLYQQGYDGVSVDHICEEAGVKKGSFYHFFRSKDDLVLAALDAHWDARRPVLDALFSPAVPPLDRLRDYFDHVHRRQLELRKRFGRVVGCLFHAVGLHAATPEIARTVQEILDLYSDYYESALRDAVAKGALPPLRDVPGKARALFAFMEGALAQARIHDDPERLRQLGRSALEFLGAAAPAPPPTPRRAHAGR